ncbi:Methionine gamma-lyase [Fusobacterium polymorphum]|uniref:L-methionine gamma-lyase n=2 Tax=Fusobacterium nucleatum subsp. polymorphum TaxID=76857 RepID=MEGL_FUSNP|nr:methionine gamma-lyase [Fusobacterium polymorphum]Q8L0X4.1 RecName: Full=L-methionine gamma-lyase; Short=MGL; AltName: Full=Homocysteine desulfhydrase; AltName: Full=L-methionine-alpha-deamino-gamma-mercaptomethane-lyase; Short=METase [Fusobacterium polymorphum]EDK89830.1 methionine gamma-lyase [Fusobacterium polymorphum ATCC 10953]UTI52741.1 methionine gamma-lyase [Fusobacterium polymorphum]WRL69485.1 methionine gamma-lyase [Fusobacterium polymorphum]CKH12129.1 Methionine gamma-lyase [Fuso
METKKYGLGTTAIHAGTLKNLYGTLAMPIYQTSTFIFDSAEQGGRRFALEEAGYIYTRLGNPTTTVLENKIAALEEGEAAVATSSGMGAISSTLWTVLKAGDHVVTDKTLYGCTFALMCHGLTRFGIEVTFVDTSNLDEVKNAMKKNTRVVYLETPANPNLKIVDLEALSKLAHTNPNTLVIVDNTFATPYMQKPLKLGADIVVHSVTKYINGHGDVIAGLVITNKELADQIRFIGLKDMTGAVLGPQDAYYIIRGMKTFEIRMERHCKNAKKVVEFLNKHPKIERVYYPGLETHPGHEIAKKQMKDFGAMISFELKGGFEAGKTLLNNLKLCSLAVSLGDTETLIQHPASMTHSPYTKEEREAAGITDGLVRLSVGLENVEDIIADLEQGLEKI